MNLYRLHVKKGIDPPEDWTRVLVPFAGSGLRLHEEFRDDCVIEAGPLLIKQIMGVLDGYIELFDYDPSEKERLRRNSLTGEDEGYSW